jgi:hypothetical protein
MLSTGVLAAARAKVRMAMAVWNCIVIDDRRTGTGAGIGQRVMMFGYEEIVSGGLRLKTGG